MDPITSFKASVKQNLVAQGNNALFKQQSVDWLIASCQDNYSYNFTSLGRPTIQYPQDLIAIQELIWRLKPNLIIQTGIAHGGLLVLSAAFQQLNGLGGRVLGIDIDIRAHNRQAIEQHPMATHIDMLEGSSLDETILTYVREQAKQQTRVMVILDSHHTHEHVYQECLAYAPMVTQDSYLIVLDTIIEFMPADAFPNRPWGIGNNPYTAVQQFLSENAAFQVDEAIDNQLLISVGPGGYLKRVQAL